MCSAAVLISLLAVGSPTFAALVERQSVPSCAISCLTNANTYPCAATDEACLCTNQAFLNSTFACILSSCSGSDVQDAEAFAKQLCLTVGVTLTTSPASSTSTPTQSSSSSTSSLPSSSHTNGAPITNTISVFVGVVVVLAIAAVL